MPVYYRSAAKPLTFSRRFNRDAERASACLKQHRNILGKDLSQDGQSEHLIRKADEYFAWAAEDSKLVGMAPWHYGNRPSSVHERGAGLLRPLAVRCARERHCLSLRFSCHPAKD